MILKYIGVLLAMVLLLPIYSYVIYASSGSAGCLENISFYMFGASWCPHCKNLDKFFSNEFPGLHYFCVIDKVSECHEKFTSLTNDFNLGGYVPTTIVVKNSKHILAIVIGEVVDREFWLNLSCLAPSESIPVYSGSSEVFKIQLNTTDHSKYIEKYIIFPQLEKPGLPSEYIITIVIIAIAFISIIGYVVLGRLGK